MAALAVGFGTFQLSATILPANVPNLVMSGTAEGSYGIHLNYVPYLLLHTPVLGILKGGILIGLICWLFPGSPKPATDLTPSEPMGRDEKRLAAAGGGAGDVGDRELAWHWARRGRALRRRSSSCCHASGLSPVKSFLRE